MFPYFIIVITALIGSLVSGWKGFLLWGGIAVPVLWILSAILRAFSGGFLPRRVRETTSSDFVTWHKDLFDDLLPDLSVPARQQYVEEVLEEIYIHALQCDSTLGNRQIANKIFFLRSALLFADLQSCLTKKKIVTELIGFIQLHPMWYGYVRG